MRYGSRVLRQGRSRPLARYHFRRRRRKAAARSAVWLSVDAEERRPLACWRWSRSTSVTFIAKMQRNRLAHSKGATARRLLARAAGVAVVAVLMLPLALLAHAHLRKSEPAARERLASPPTAIRLWFSERPELAFTRIQLRSADSTEIALGAVAHMSDDPLGVWTTIPTTLAAGSYTVLWRTAAADGHATSGRFAFEIIGGARPVVIATDTAARGAATHAPPVRVDSTAEEPAPINVIAATRWLEFVAMLAVVGAVVFRLLVVRLAERTMAGTLASDTVMDLADSVRRLAQSALVLLLIAAVSRLYAEASAVLGPNRAIDRAALQTLLLDTSWGAGWLVGVAGIFVAGAGFSI